MARCDREIDRAAGLPLCSSVAATRGERLGRAIRGAEESARQPEGGRAKRLGERGETCGARRRGEGRTTPPLALRYVRRTPTHLHLTPPPQSSLDLPACSGTQRGRLRDLPGAGRALVKRRATASSRCGTRTLVRFGFLTPPEVCGAFFAGTLFRHQLTHSFFFRPGVCACVVFAVLARRERSASAFRPPLFSPSSLFRSAPGVCFVLCSQFFFLCSAVAPNEFGGLHRVYYSPIDKKGWSRRGEEVV